jgi:hypothetical protein
MPWRAARMRLSSSSPVSLGSSRSSSAAILASSSGSSRSGGRRTAPHLRLGDAAFGPLRQAERQFLHDEPVDDLGGVALAAGAAQQGQFGRHPPLRRTRPIGQRLPEFALAEQPQAAVDELGQHQQEAREDAHHDQQLDQREAGGMASQGDVHRAVTSSTSTRDWPSYSTRTSSMRAVVFQPCAR